MKRTNRYQAALLTPAAVAMTGVYMMTSSLQAELILLEQFDYEGVDQPLNGSDGGEGFDGAWTVNGWSRNYDIGRTMFAPGTLGSTVNANGGLDFGDHPSAGSALSRFGTAGQREAHRILTASSISALTADGTTIWFSVLAGAPNGNKFGTMIFGTDPLVALQGSAENGNLSADGQGFGITFTAEGNLGGTGSPNALAFIDSTLKTIANGSFLPEIEPGATHHDTVLVVGKINWNANGTEDELFLFNMETTGLPEPAEGDAIATLTADFDQTTWDTIALQDTGSTIYDEIRFGNTFSDVTSGAPAAPFCIRTLSYSAVDNSVTISWDSVEGQTFAVKYSRDMTNWDADLDDGVAADVGETTTTRTFMLTPSAISGDETVYFRIEKQ